VAHFSARVVVRFLARVVARVVVRVVIRVAEGVSLNLLSRVCVRVVVRAIARALVRRQACGVSGLSEAEYRRVALQPFGADKRVFMANNDWVAMDVAYMFGDWAEETLLQAERALRTLGMPKPEWLNQSYYDAKIAPFAVPAESLLRQAAA